MNEVFEKIKEKLEHCYWFALRSYDEDGYGNDDGIEVVTLYTALNIVDQVEEEYNNGWIPCSERLPEHLETIIFTTEDGMVESGWYDANKNWCVNDSYFPNAFEFIYWQPLPAPPKKEV